MAEKVTIMVLKVDFQCSCCYKKVKGILCKFPQIQDQVYDVKANSVTITVMCCNPEKIRDKLCYKGAGVIKSIEIKEPLSSTPSSPLSSPPSSSPSSSPSSPSTKLFLPRRTCCGPCSEGRGGGPCYDGYVVLLRTCCGPCSEGRGGGSCYDGNVVPPRTCCGPCSEGRGGGPCYDGNVVPPKTCCGPCSQGYGGGPCYDGYGVPPPAQPCYDGYYGQGSRSCRASGCDYYLSDYNPQGCSIM
ncbi:hypothetical protein BUALT_Bualt03G0090900 [Buddleja alternifolia]|uniref:Uncharacterized protein n=1 Tax=Buddleja alternifolia TaxID=168488 RepID=A0AAV6XTT9_9LAMI|nr:hypothetical protein BUALT_Bualt03G0090900 [Buddleja alternifolia]